MKATHIGTIPLGIDSADAYYLLELELGDVSNAGYFATDAGFENTARTLFEQKALGPCNGPGTVFCDRVTIIPHPLWPNERYIGVQHIRRDC